MALATTDGSQEAYAFTRSQTLVSKEALQGAGSTLDPQHGKDNWQAQLPQSFTLEEMVPMASMVPQP